MIAYEFTGGDIFFICFTVFACTVVIGHSIASAAQWIARAAGWSEGKGQCFRYRKE